MKENNKQQSVEQHFEQGIAPIAAATYKDRIFRMIFKEKKEFLELYNAINGTTHENPDDLIVTMLDNAIYMGMRNDVSFLIYDRLTLYEHQSTNNPNMPLRNLFYVSDVYSKIVKDKNLYGTKMIKIPEPKFIVFYNGVTKTPERFVKKLSEMYDNPSEHVSLELETQVFNINLGYNCKLMEKCKTLHDYAVFVDLVRRYRKTLTLEEAIDRAILECIRGDVLAEFLKKNKAEVLKMGIYEYNEEEHIRMEREDAREEGIGIGMERGIECGELLTLIRLIKKKVLKSKSLEIIADEVERKEDDIWHIYDLIKSNPELSEDKILERIKK